MTVKFSAARRLLNLLLCLCACSAGVHAQTTAPLTSIAALDVPRYMGTWYEIAKYPNTFQKKCVSGTCADYSLQANGRLSVVNRCTQEDGQLREAIGEAQQIGAATSRSCRCVLPRHGCLSSRWSGATTGS